MTAAGVTATAKRDDVSWDTINTIMARSKTKDPARDNPASNEGKAIVTVHKVDWKFHSLRKMPWHIVDEDNAQIIADIEENQDELARLDPDAIY